MGNLAQDVGIMKVDSLYKVILKPTVVVVVVGAATVVMFSCVHVINCCM